MEDLHDNLPNTHKKGPRAQAATEYLITYGWAVLLIALAVTFIYFYLIGPYLVASNTCSFTTPITCQDSVLGINLTTGNAKLILLLTNSQQYPIESPVIFANINGTNTTGSACIPGYVPAGGDMICRLPVSNNITINRYLSGKLYLNASNCAFGANVSAIESCASPITETYVGQFGSHAQQIFSTNVIIVLTSSATSVPINNTITLYATVGIAGSPVRGVPVNFSESSQIPSLKPQYATTSTAGIAESFIRSPSLASVTVTATSLGSSSNILISFMTTTSTTTSVTSTTAPSSTTTTTTIPYPALSITPSSIYAGNAATVSATCYGADTCAVDMPLGTHLCSATSACTYTTPAESAGTYTFYADDVSYSLSTSGNLVVSSSALPPKITFNQSYIYSGNSINAIVTCQGSDSCALDYPLGTQMCEGTATCSNVLMVSTPGSYTYYANDLTSGLTSSNSFVVLSANAPTITITPNVIYLGNTATVSVTCHSSDTCAVDFPLGTHLCQGTTTCSNTITGTTAGSFTYFGNDMTNKLTSSQVLKVENTPVSLPYSFVVASASYSLATTNSLTVGSSSYNSFFFAVGGSVQATSTTAPTVSYTTYTPASQLESETFTVHAVSTYVGLNTSAVGNSLTDQLSFSYSQTGSAGIVGLATTLPASSLESFQSKGKAGVASQGITFNVLNPGDVAYILGAAGASFSGATVSLPSGCTIANQITVSGGYNVWAANCIFSSSGTYTANFTDSGKHQPISIAVWVFN
ncbi:MAG TPA: hypothetical protein VL944_02645 [Candidatus Acidoferrum sp.]|nr:hypothetical protein [Candidatus Acidoferrum sp.]